MEGPPRAGAEPGCWGVGGGSLHEAPQDSEYSRDKDKGPGRSLKKYRLLVAAEGPPPHPALQALSHQPPISHLRIWGP